MDSLKAGMVKNWFFRGALKWYSGDTTPKRVPKLGRIEKQMDRGYFENPFDSHLIPLLFINYHVFTVFLPNLLGLSANRRALARVLSRQLLNLHFNPSAMNAGFITPTKSLRRISSTHNLQACYHRQLGSLWLRVPDRFQRQTA